MAPVASRLADERPDEVALHDDRVALGWAEVSEALNRVANGLRALDLGPQQRAAVLAENSAETVLAHLGGLLAGISTVPTNFHLNAEEVAYILQDSGTRVLFVGPETVETGLAAARQAGVPLVVGWRCPALEGLTPWEGWLAAADPSEPPTDVAPRPTSCTRRARRAGPRASSCRPTMFAGGSNIEEHLAALAGRRVRPLRHPPRDRADVPHRPPLGRPAAGRRASRSWCSAGSTPRGCSRPSTRTTPRRTRDGADPLRPAAGPARRGAGPLRRQLGQARRPHRRGLPDRRQAADDRVVGPGVLRRLRRHRGRHDLHDHERGVAGAPRLGRPRHAALHAPSSSTTTGTRWPAARKVGSSSRTPPAGASSTRATPRRPPTPTSARASSPWARSATSTTTATCSSRTASAT